MRAGFLLSLTLWAGIFWLLSLTGCSAVGIKEIDLWGARMTFADGVDYRVGFNAIDQVDDRRGLSRRAASNNAGDRY